VNANGSNDDEMPSLPLADWGALEAATRKELLTRLDAWRDDLARREAILLARIQAGRQLPRLNQISKVMITSTSCIAPTAKPTPAHSTGRGFTKISSTPCAGSLDQRHRHSPRRPGFAH
jgi:hypothetical protein